MNSKLIGGIIFVAGVGVGSAATWKFAKTKYERIAQEEIDSVKEVYSKLDSQNVSEVVEKNNDMSEYEDKVRESGYAGNEENEKKGDTMTSKPYIISPEEYGDFDDYKLVSLTYYSDGILADDIDQSMTEEAIAEFVGKDFASHFGEYEDDSVFVRNDDKQIDFEIIRDLRTYKEVVG